MGSTSETARRLLGSLIRREPWSREWLDELIAAGAPELFSIVAEGLSDRFEPELVEAYVDVFSEVLAAVEPGRNAADLAARYRRVRKPRRFEGNAEAVRTVYVLSRVTLGADVAITSVVLDAAKRRFPRARIVFTGPVKSYELFAADPRIKHLPVSYGRNGSLHDRIAVCPLLDEQASIVIDPDSRITQLGLLPVCPDENYWFFESRAYGGDGTESLGALTRRWVAETFGIENARAFLAPREEPEIAPATITCSLGVGGNAAKRMPDPFEPELVRALAAEGELLIDSGAGGEECERVRRAIDASGVQVRTWQGSFAGFASLIARSRLFVGYDSAGQHAAAACGVPLVTVFAGAPCDRFRQRWQPTGPGPIAVVRADRRPVSDVLEETLRAVLAVL